MNCSVKVIKQGQKGVPCCCQSLNVLLTPQEDASQDKISIVRMISFAGSCDARECIGMVYYGVLMCTACFLNCSSSPLSQYPEIPHTRIIEMS